MAQSIKPLEFVEVRSQFDLGWMASTGFGSHYFIHVKRETGKTVVRTLESKDESFNSVDEAKEWCDNDYRNKAFSIIDTLNQH